MRAGEHVWKVSIRYRSIDWDGTLLGVAEKPGLTANRENNWKQVYGWYSSGVKTILSKRYKHSLQKWQNNDILQFHLNCTNHTLTITNTRSAETDTITNLPLTELFAYFRTCNQGEALTLVP